MGLGFFWVVLYACWPQPLHPLSLRCVGIQGYFLAFSLPWTALHDASTLLLECVSPLHAPPCACTHSRDTALQCTQLNPSPAMGASHPARGELEAEPPDSPQAAQQQQQQLLNPALDAWSLVGHAVQRYGSLLAVVDRSAGPEPEQAKQLRYDDLAHRASALASHLRAAWGVRRGDRVGVMLRNCVEVMEAHFAAAGLHAVIVNLNTNLAPRELAHVLRDSGTQALIVDAEFAAPVTAALELLSSSSGLDGVGTGATGGPGGSEIEAAAGSSSAASQQRLALSNIAWVIKPGAEPRGAAAAGDYVVRLLQLGVRCNEYEGESGPGRLLASRSALCCTIITLRLQAAGRW